MPALILKKIPGKPPFQNYLAEPDKFKGIKGEISWILVAPPIMRLCSREFVPLLAGNLAAAAGRTPRGINKEDLFRHWNHTSFLFTFTMNALVSGIMVFGSHAEEVRRLELSPPSLGVTHPKHHGSPT